MTGRRSWWTRGLAVRAVLAAVVTAALGVVLSPAAHAAGTALTPKLEAWYQPDPTCALPSGCLLSKLPALPSLPVALPIGPTNPYPVGTLHVGFASQKETARTYLSFDFGDLFQLASARLDIPLDTATLDGSVAPDTAKVQVCLASGDLTAVSASYLPPPAFSCDEHATLTYVATPQPHLTGDLKPIMVGLPTTTGIVLLPDLTAVKATDVWQVAFSAHDRTGTGNTPPATLTVTDGTAPASAAASSPATHGVPSTPAAVPSSVDVPPVYTGPAVTIPDTGPAAIEQPSVTPPSVAGVPQPATDVPAPAAALSSTDAFQYPVVLLFPLLLLVVVPAAARALTRDLDATDLLDDAPV